MALSLARLFSSQLAVSRVGLLWRSNIIPCVVPIANKQTVAEELGLPTPPKRPISAYLRWVSFHRDEYRRKFPKLTFLDVNRKLAETWNGLGVLEKETWSAEYRKDKEIFDKQYEDYMKKLTPEQITNIKNLKKKRSQDKVKRQMKREKRKDNEELGKPKHPGNAFTLYLMSLDRGNFPLKDFLTTAAASWKQLPEEQLKIYKDKAAKNREQYNRELHEWELKMIRAGRADLVRQHQQLEDLKRSSQGVKFPDE